MYRKILVAIDRSSQSEAVFEQALEVAKKEDASLMVLHCMSEFQGSTIYGNMYGSELVNFSHEMRTQWSQEREQARQWLALYSEKATVQGVPTQTALKLGDAGSSIRKLAEDWGADLIVLGRRGRRGLAEIVLGSVSNYVVHYAPCSVLVVQGKTTTETHQAVTQAKSEEQPV